METIVVPSAADIITASKMTLNAVHTLGDVDIEGIDNVWVW